MAPFKSLGAAAVAVLARQAAIKLVKSQLQAQGERVPLSALHVRVDAYLRDHPELVEQAMARL
jgi:hypothetical protein